MFFLEEVTLPASVNKLGAFAFGWCNGLKRVYFEGEPPIVPSGDVTPFQDVHGDMYYWAEKGNWTQKVKDSLTNAGRVQWSARHAEDAEHIVSTEWRTNELVHWHQCEGCGQEYDKAEHVFESANDIKCDACGYVE